MKILTQQKHKRYEGAELVSAPTKTQSNLKKDCFVKEKKKNPLHDFVKNRGLQSVTRFAQELNINDLRQKSKSQNENMFNLSDGTALLIALNQRTYDLNDDYVSKAPIRLAKIQELQKKYPKEKIYFQENMGLAEAGDGFYATLPVFRSGLGSIGMGFGFSAGAILRYRSSQAFVSNKKKPKRMLLPLTPECARKMPAASEFELRGQGKIRADIAINARYGAGAGVAVAGAQAGLGVSAQLAAEYSINVLSLDGNNRVRVMLRKLNQESGTISASVLVGLIFPGNSIWRGNLGAPQLGHGFLKYFVEHKGNATFESYINDYTTLSLNASLSHTHKGTHICTFDVDLSNARAAKAYKDLMALDMSLALELASSNDGVSKIELKEGQHTQRAALRLALCSEKLFLAEALKTKSHGELSDEQGSHHVYNDRSYKRHRENWLSGQRDILWEAIQIKKDQEKAETYFHFNYQKNDFITRQHKINDFFLFAEALGIRHACESTKKLIDMHYYKKLFSSADDTKLLVDLYFNPEGVERIRRSSEEQIIQAFINTKAQRDPQLLEHPCLINDAENKLKSEEIYGMYEHIKSNYNLYYRKTLPKLKDSYFVLTKRNLKYDYKVFKEALRFARRTYNLVAKDQKHSKIGKLFTSIGRSHAGHYATVIPTLALLAGRNNVLVHTLSVSGGNVVLKSIDEGALTHPRNEFLKSYYQR